MANNMTNAFEDAIADHIFGGATLTSAGYDFTNIQVHLSTDSFAEGVTTPANVPAGLSSAAVAFTVTNNVAKNTSDLELTMTATGPSNIASVYVTDDSGTPKVLFGGPLSVSSVEQNDIIRIAADQLTITFE